MEKSVIKFSFKNHLTYNGWKYVILIIISIFFWSLAFSVTEYQSPPELSVSVYLIDEYMPLEETEKMVEQTSPYLPDMEKIEFTSPIVAEDEYNRQQYLMVMLGAGQGDIFIVNKQTMEGIISQDGVAPLDDYLNSGALDVKGLDISSGRLRPFLISESGYTAVDEEGNLLADESQPERQYAIPIGELYGFLTQNYYDCRDLYAIVMVYSQNQDNAIKMLQAIIDEKLEPRPDWLDEYERQERETEEASANNP